MLRKYRAHPFIAARILQCSNETDELPTALSSATPEREWLVKRLLIYAGFRKSDIELLLANPPVRPEHRWRYYQYENNGYMIRSLAAGMPYRLTREAAIDQDWISKIIMPRYSMRIPVELDPYEPPSQEFWSDPACTHYHVELSLDQMFLISYWSAREAFRLANRDYSPVPWLDELEEIPGHFVHCSMKKPGLVSFTENPDKGARDIQAPGMKPGRYLTKFYPDINPQSVKSFAALIDGAAALHFAITEDEFEHVYTHGPNSCMSHKASEYQSPFHPVRIYAAGDLQLAYLCNTAGDISDRVLVWPEKKIYGRVYGAADGRIQRLLEEQGYSEGSLRGAKLQRKMHNGSWLVCPYIDCEQSVKDHEDYLTIGGDISAGSTHGLIDLEPEEGEETYIYDLDEYRSEEWAEENAWMCELSERVISNESAPVTFIRRQRRSSQPDYWQEFTQVHKGFASDYGVYSEREEAYVAYRDIHTLPDDTCVSLRYYQENKAELDEEYGLNQEQEEADASTTETTITPDEPQQFLYETIPAGTPLALLTNRDVVILPDGREIPLHMFVEGRVRVAEADLDVDRMFANARAAINRQQSTSAV